MKIALDFKTMNELILRMKDTLKINPIESEFIAINLYNYLYNINKNNYLSEDYEFPISLDDINLIIAKSEAFEKRYKKFQCRMLILSLVIIISVFVIQFFVVKASIWFSLTVAISLGLMDMYFLNKTLFPKFLNGEEKKILKNVSPRTLKLCRKLN